MIFCMNKRKKKVTIQSAFGRWLFMWKFIKRNYKHKMKYKLYLKTDYGYIITVVYNISISF